jgi:hypothetical protein
MSLTTVDGSLISSGAITLTTQVTGTLPEANGGTGTTVGYCGFKSRIINGNMVIDQRNAGASVSAANSGYTLDRWFSVSYDSGAQTGKFTVQQNAGSVTPPVGFTNYLGVTSSAATSVSGNGIYAITQNIEGYNIADLAWGTASAKSVTISFWVYSSLTGTFGGALNNSAGNYNYPFQFVILSANTWTYCNVVIPAPTSGTWLTTNGTGVSVRFGLGAGVSWSDPVGVWTTNAAYTADSSVSVVGTNGATFYITGVQLEKGSTATSFDYRPYGTELQLCQRYYEVDSNNNTSLFWSGNTTSTSTYYLPVKYAVTKRSNATVTLANINNSGFPNTITIGEQGISGFRVDTTANASVSAGYFRASWVASAEL